MEVGDDDFYIDLLFYHLHLRCFIVIDLKVGKFTRDIRAIRGQKLAH
jgi:predicted nuclease of restriction endonuclease-like (RecB) superfamily